MTHIITHLSSAGLIFVYTFKHEFLDVGPRCITTIEEYNWHSYQEMVGMDY